MIGRAILAFSKLRATFCAKQQETAAVSTPRRRPLILSRRGLRPAVFLLSARTIHITLKLIYINFRASRPRMPIVAKLNNNASPNPPLLLSCMHTAHATNPLHPHPGSLWRSGRVSRAVPGGKFNGVKIVVELYFPCGMPSSFFIFRAPGGRCCPWPARRWGNGERSVCRGWRQIAAAAAPASAQQQLLLQPQRLSARRAAN